MTSEQRRFKPASIALAALTATVVAIPWVRRRRKPDDPPPVPDGARQHAGGCTPPHVVC